MDFPPDSNNFVAVHTTTTTPTIIPTSSINVSTCSQINLTASTITSPTTTTTTSTFESLSVDQIHPSHQQKQQQQLQCPVAGTLVVPVVGVCAGNHSEPTQFKNFCKQQSVANKQCPIGTSDPLVDQQKQLSQSVDQPNLDSEKYCDFALSGTNSLHYSIQEIRLFKVCINKKIEQLEQLVERLKCIFVCEIESKDKSSVKEPPKPQPLPVELAQSKPVGKKMKKATLTKHNNGKSRNLAQSNGPSCRTVVTSETVDCDGDNSRATSVDSPVAHSMEELRTILADIDQHLVVLKEAEERHAMICETYTHEIRVRDETLMGKMKQINQMNNELSLLHSQINHLVLKNQQLENEIKFFKTISSMTDTETPSTPVNNENFMRSSSTPPPPNSSVDIYGQRTPTDMTLELLEQSNTGAKITENSHNIPNNAQWQSVPVDKETLAIKLDNIQSKIDPIPALTLPLLQCKNPRVQKYQATNQFDAGGSTQFKWSQEKLSIDDPVNESDLKEWNKKQNISTTVYKTDQNYQEMYVHLLNRYRLMEKMLQDKNTVIEMNTQNEQTECSTNDEDTKMKDIKFENETLATKVTEESGVPVETNSDDSSLLNGKIQNYDDPKKETENLQMESQMDKCLLSEVSVDKDDTTLANANGEKGNLKQDTKTVSSPEPGEAEVEEVQPNYAEELRQLKNDLEKTKLTTEWSSGGQGLDNDVVQTSIKAYEHFVKMQHDLEKLMNNEEKYRTKIEELTEENRKLSEQREEDEFKLSEVQYELDILKHNYNLEIESFGTAINERESLIEKLQQKVESLKRRFMKLDDRFKSSVEKEVGYKSSIEEFEGRLKYEQLQRKTVIDTRVSELEKQLADNEAEYQLEIKNLRTDVACRMTVESELRARIEELENSLKAMGTPEFEEEFVYYKSQIDLLVKELEGEKQDKQRLIDKYEEDIRLKDKLTDQIREQMRKEKDAQLREKAEYEQKYRKLNAKFKAKEREIQSLQEKLQLLEQKFRARISGEVNNLDHKQTELLGYSTSLGEHQATTIKTVDGEYGQQMEAEKCSKGEELLMTQLALNEVKLSELNTKFEDAQEQLEQLNELLNKERERRRDLETYYMSTINHRNQSFSSSMANTTTAQQRYSVDGINLMANSAYYSHHQHYHHSSGSAMFAGRQAEDSFYGTDLPLPSSSTTTTTTNHRNSTASLALLMEDNDKEPREKNFLDSIYRTMRRQKDILVFGGPKAKAIRVGFLLYLLVLHYFAIEFYLN